MDGGRVAGARGGMLSRLWMAEPPPIARLKHVYRIKFPEEHDGRPAKDVEFEAHDSSEALLIAHREARSRSAELWCDGAKICTIRRTPSNVWEIWPL